MSIKIDAIDRRILNVLQEDGRIQNVELARRVGLSPSACLRRVRLLEETGVIVRYVAQINPSLVDAGFTVFARVWLKEQDEKTVNGFIREVMAMPEVMECHLMAGDSDFLLRVTVADLDAYRQFQITRLNPIKDVQNVKTDIPMQQIKQSSRILL
ncbi:MAG: Lrp/AsnC family transcriptional regulator [Oxalobacter sp.]|nr:Lrp/AsnC family transcriptional regulator [Oxalobacter sp.]